MLSNFFFFRYYKDEKYIKFIIYVINIIVINADVKYKISVSL